jgi:acyl-CoA dehydrogenase
MSDEMNISDMLAEQVSRLFSAQVDREALIKVENGTFDTALWDEVENMGVTLALVSEEAGGAGLSWAESEQVLRLSGVHAAPVPLGETAIGAWALASAGLEFHSGALAVSSVLFSLDEAGKLHGSDPLLNWGSVVGQVVLVAERAGSRFVCLVDASAGEVAAVNTIDRLPSAAFTLDGVAPAQLAEAGFLGELGLLPHLATLKVTQMAGALAHVLELCVEYANTRVQFGKPIGKFQAIQHMIADLAGQAAAAQVAGLYACRQIDAGNAAYGAAAAKSLVGRAATRATAIAHQVFGAIGVTDEHTLHYYTRRLWQWRAEAGSDHYWSERLGKQTLAQEGTALWKRLSSPLG